MRLHPPRGLSGHLTRGAPARLDMIGGIDRQGPGSGRRSIGFLGLDDRHQIGVVAVKAERDQEFHDPLFRNGAACCNHACIDATHCTSSSYVVIVL